MKSEIAQNHAALKGRKSKYLRMTVIRHEAKLHVRKICFFFYIYVCNPLQPVKTFIQLKHLQSKSVKYGFKSRSTALKFSLQNSKTATANKNLPALLSLFGFPSNLPSLTRPGVLILAVKHSPSLLLSHVHGRHYRMI